MTEKRFGAAEAWSSEPNESQALRPVRKECHVEIHDGK